MKTLRILMMLQHLAQNLYLQAGRMTSSSDPRLQTLALPYQIELAPALALIPRGPIGHPCFPMPTSTSAGTGIIRLKYAVPALAFRGQAVPAPIIL